MFTPTTFSFFALLFLPSLFISPIAADSQGDVLWKPPVDNELNNYARVIELKHAGDKNDRLLATWEHTYTEHPQTRKTNGTAGEFIIRQSQDGGKSWSTLKTVHNTKPDPKGPFDRFFQPFFFEFPHQMGKYPEGTLLLVGNLLPGHSSSTNFYAWRSADHGKTWTDVGVWQRGGKARAGIWEPFLYTDDKGKLVAIFSDERNHTKHSQMLSIVTSDDGGDTWTKPKPAVASTKVHDRPGMSSVAKMDNGEYVLSYEFCGHKECPAHHKMSKDGVSWDPSYMGTRIQTADGIHAGSTPYTVWDPSTKQLILSTHFIYRTSNNKASPQDHRAVFINYNYGKGDWYWAPSPWSVPKDTEYCHSNYSPNLLPRSNGTVRYTAPASNGADAYCRERTGEVPIGALPYASNFKANGQAGWINLGGEWTVSDDEYRFQQKSGSESAIAVTGSTGWTDYTITGDVMLTGNSGSAGLNVRMTASDKGLNNSKGYMVAIDSSSGKLTTSVYGSSDSKGVLHSKPHPGGIQQNKWYQLSVTSKQDKFIVTLSEEQSHSKTAYTITDRTFNHGLVGLSGGNGSGSFRNISITH